MAKPLGLADFRRLLLLGDLGVDSLDGATELLACDTWLGFNRFRRYRLGF